MFGANVVRYLCGKMCVFIGVVSSVYVLSLCNLMCFCVHKVVSSVYVLSLCNLMCFCVHKCDVLCVC